jgi:hypothetical protein
MLNNLNIQKGPRKLAHYYCSSLSLYLSRTRLERMKGRLLVLLNSTGTEFTLTWKKKNPVQKMKENGITIRRPGSGFLRRTSAMSCGLACALHFLWTMILYTLMKPDQLRWLVNHLTVHIRNIKCWFSSHLSTYSRMGEIESLQMHLLL